jgi:hypothetical protein
MQVSSDRGRFAERVLHGIDDGGNEEQIVVWIEHREGALWAVGRSVGQEHRHGSSKPRLDIIFEGHELSDALDCANEALEDDIVATGREERCLPFTRDEVLRPLERWFFGRGRLH